MYYAGIIITQNVSCEYADGEDDYDDDAELSRNHFIQKKNNWSIIRNYHRLLYWARKKNT